MSTVVEVTLILAACFIGYLILCAVVVLRTGTTDGLKAVGDAVHALIGPVAQLLRRWPIDTHRHPDQ
ncbi:hypothetical protein OG921_24150 [Aldersonia sp. NBC_00410]|uniref:hypothetical protein n=1 Tax=Aldersonia sp. NBC_00410 TaxID=2975954 RepID=UPI002256DDB1|nr:hypothetical protein [Aldersonia sp. NBC_00410]MCX5046268.1 hypothetical protein [Aldersonia sp. NBC_00410]